jgi:hypothetical protein
MRKRDAFLYIHTYIHIHIHTYIHTCTCKHGHKHSGRVPSSAGHRTLDEAQRGMPCGVRVRPLRCVAQERAALCGEHLCVFVCVCAHACLRRVCHRLHAPCMCVHAYARLDCPTVLRSLFHSSTRNALVHSCHLSWRCAWPRSVAHHNAMRLAP